MEPTNAAEPAATRADEAQSPIKVTLTPEEFTALRANWRDNTRNNGQAQLALMLYGRARWQMPQIAEFLGCSVEQVGHWVEGWQTRGLGGLTG